ncbi:hypothetical protein [Desulfosporosinus sp. BG]|uniref:hypothetical protein n=1 Tax=Desulfosporosinus sp. BG TaxID=1633135 RepID=UPI00083B1476|nr:hypothetical protein [Desulfosporosinus sp. BG]ODA41435.1 hypothetical protein DSBG_1711 [Desulfosporosinus sp. BG]
MRTLVKNLLSSFSSPEAPQLSEAEHLLAEIEDTRVKMKYAWNRLDFAAPEYVEIAVLELLLVETQYSLLNRRYRLLQGSEKESPYFMTSTRRLPFSLEHQLQNHAFYRAFCLPAEESPPLTAQKGVSQNPHWVRNL